MFHESICKRIKILLLSLYTICKVQISGCSRLLPLPIVRGIRIANEPQKRTRSDMTQPPCPPLSDAQWPEAIVDMRDGFAGQLNVYRTMAHHPALLRAWAPLRQHLVKNTALGAERSEMVILRTGHRLGSAYEWAHHVSRARTLGFSDDRIRSIAAAPSGEDGLIVRAVDALFDLHRIPADLEADLASTIGREAVFDLIATVGFYTVLGGILQTYETPIDDGIAEELARAPI
jgi:alkylhydroperoxidase family enzyme